MFWGVISNVQQKVVKCSIMPTKLYTNWLIHFHISLQKLDEANVSLLRVSKVISCNWLLWLFFNNKMRHLLIQTLCRRPQFEYYPFWNRTVNTGGCGEADGASFSTIFWRKKIFFSVKLKSGTCYITGQWGRFQNKIK